MHVKENYFYEKKALYFIEYISKIEKSKCTDELHDAKILKKTGLALKHMKNSIFFIKDNLNLKI